MSFSSDVRKELIKHYTKAVHCQAAELAAAAVFQGIITEDGILLSTEGEEAAKKYTAQIKKVFGVPAQIAATDAVRSGRKQVWKITIQAADVLEKVSCLTALIRKEDKQEELDRLLKKNCCKRAFLRGAFIASGMISNPEKQYHLEIRCTQMKTAEYIKELIRSFSINARISTRRDKFIVYIKEGVEIADFLNVTEAHVALMEFENIRIVREMRGNVNRKVNCETANIGKTVNAAMKQIADINYIKDTIGFEALDSSLREVAQVRLEHPDTPLSSLGELMQPPLGKSGVNHRLRKLVSIADDLRKQEQP